MIAPGSKYAETKDLATHAVAHLIRIEIRKLVDAGTIPGLKVHVRTRLTSLSAAIDMHVVGFDGPIYRRGHRAVGIDDWRSPEALALEARLQAIAAAYNFSDLANPWNIRFHAHVKWGEDLCHADRERKCAAERESQRRSRDQASMRAAALRADAEIVDETLVLATRLEIEAHAETVVRGVSLEKRLQALLRDPSDPTLVPQ